jgi:hypothetical protein
MRKSLWIVPLLFLSAAIGSTTARADSFDYYSIAFSGPNAPAAAAGTVLTYDATTQQFTTPSFSLTFEGNVYTVDLFPTPDADNPPTIDSIFWTATLTRPIVIFDNTIGDDLYFATTPETTATAANGGVTLTATSAPVPEIDPTTGISALTLLVGAVLIIRGRRWKLT